MLVLATAVTAMNTVACIIAAIIWIFMTADMLLRQGKKELPTFREWCLFTILLVYEWCVVVVLLHYVPFE